MKNSKIITLFTLFSIYVVHKKKKKIVINVWCTIFNVVILAYSLLFISAMNTALDSLFYCRPFIFLAVLICQVCFSIFINVSTLQQEFRRLPTSIRTENMKIIINGQYCSISQLNWEMQLNSSILNIFFFF